MITTVLFDMGGTLEDIFVDEASEREAVEKLAEILKDCGLDPKVDLEELKRRVDAGWKRYGAYRDSCDVELKPVEIWCDYVLTDFGFPRETLAPRCEEIAHMWEVTHYHRRLRPRVIPMLEGLKEMGVKLGIISNTAALSVTGFRKPCTDIFTVSLRQVQSKPEECVYVGDTVSRDVIGSKRAGFAKAIQICSKLTGEKDSGIRREYEPDYMVEDIYEVYPIVQQLREAETV